MSQLEEMVEDWSGEDGIVSAWAAYVSNELDVQKDLVESKAKHVEVEFVDRKTEVQSEMKELRWMIESLQVDVLVLTKVVLQGCPCSNADAGPKVRIPELKSFSGNHNAKELENFLWDMEQFFKATRVPDLEKVSITSMNLMGDAKLW